MPNPLEDELLRRAQANLDKSLGRHNTVATLGIEPYHIQDTTWVPDKDIPDSLKKLVINRLQQFPQPAGPPEVRQLHQPSPYSLEKMMQFHNPRPPKTWDKPSSVYQRVIDSLIGQHPDAMKRVKNIDFEPLGGPAGNYRGRINQGYLVIDPVESINMQKESPDKALLDVIRHEMGHSLGYQDNYEDIPIDPFGNYGRRPLVDKPRDSQDIDNASHILHRK